jgi:hypothetical protein
MSPSCADNLEAIRARYSNLWSGGLCRYPRGGTTVDQEEWIGLTDAVHQANGVVSYWDLYSLAVQNRIESKRKGSRWLVRRADLDRYVAQISAT